MKLKPWKDLPPYMQNEAVKPYYIHLYHKRGQLAAKRMFDVVMSSILLLVLSPVMIVLAILIKKDSKGPVFFHQERITTNGQVFRIYKFRTMVDKADQLGTQVTTKGDARVTEIGQKIRGCRLDELPQLINVLKGEMTFVGTRPEVKKYVDQYTDKMYATLLMPAGITSRASIEYKDEEKILSSAVEADVTYVKQVLPEKMKYNLQGLEKFSLLEDIFVMVHTVLAVIK